MNDNLKVSPNQLPMNDNFGLTNFDHNADPGTEEFLRAHPNEFCVRYTAWDFYAYVAFDGEKFVIDVKQYRELVDTLEVEEFDDIIKTVSDKYGWK